MYFKPVVVTWVSGAWAESPQDFRVCGGKGEYNYTFHRPTTVQGLDKDMQFALEVQRTRAMQRQAKAQEEMQMLNLYNAINNSSSSINCTSYDYGGGMVSTRCW